MLFKNLINLFINPPVGIISDYSCLKLYLIGLHNVRTHIHTGHPRLMHDHSLTKQPLAEY